MALFDSVNRTQEDNTGTGAAASDDRFQNQDQNGTPPVEEGEVRSVTIDTLGDQGDGIAKVEHGFVVFVPRTKPGDKVEVEITDVRDSVAFAELVTEPEAR